MWICSIHIFIYLHLRAINAHCKRAYSYKKYIIMSWDIHVSKTVSKVNSILFSLKMNKHALSFNVRKHLVEALIFPHFDYACVPLINCTEFLNSKLERALNSCIRFVFKISRFFHISPYWNQLYWLKIEQRRLFV